MSNDNATAIKTAVAEALAAFKRDANRVSYAKGSSWTFEERPPSDDEIRGEYVSSVDPNALRFIEAQGGRVNAQFRGMYTRKLENGETSSKGGFHVIGFGVMYAKPAQKHGIGDETVLTVASFKNEDTGKEQDYVKDTGEKPVSETRT